MEVAVGRGFVVKFIQVLNHVFSQNWMPVHDVHCQVAGRVFIQVDLNSGVSEESEDAGCRRGPQVFGEETIKETNHNGMYQMHQPLDKVDVVVV